MGQETTGPGPFEWKAGEPLKINEEMIAKLPDADVTVSDAEAADEAITIEKAQITLGDVVELDKVREARKKLEEIEKAS